MADFHPVVWMYDDDFTKVFYNYFNVEPIIEDTSGTYAEKNADLVDKSVGWNHPISEILNSLLQSGLELKQFNEFDYSPYNCLHDMEESETGKFRIKAFGNKIPMVYSILASKKAISI
jgi:hypothetical protein